MFTKDTRILIVDDMSMMRKLIKAQLRELGFTDVTEAIKLGVSSFIRKPFSPDSLKTKIEAVWQSSQKAA